MKWISVKEQLPPKDKMLLVVIDGDNTVYPAYFDFNYTQECWISNGNWLGRFEMVTHWAELPKGPDEVD